MRPFAFARGGLQDRVLLARGLIAAIGSWTALGCSGEREALYLPWPEGEVATSAILAVIRGDQLALTAHDVGEHPRLEPESTIDLSTTPRLELLLFDQPLAELGIEAGPIALEPEGEVVPMPRATFVTEVQDERARPWAPSTPAVPILNARIRRDPRSLCATLEVKGQYETGASEDLAFAISLGPTAAIFGSRDELVTLIDETGAVAVTDLPPGLPFGAATRLPTGEVWFGGHGGAIWRGTIEVTPNPAIRAELVTTSSSAQLIRWMIVRSEPELEIFTLGVRGAFERYFRGDWSRLHDFGGEQFKGGMVSTEPGVVYAATGARPQVMRWEDGVTVDVAPAELVDGVTGLDHVPGIGLMFGAGQGLAYIERSVGNWSRLEGETIDLFIYTFAPFSEGFLIGGAVGFVAQYRSASKTFCAAEQLAAGAVRAFVPFGKGVLIAEDVPISRNRAIVTLLEAR